MRKLLPPLIRFVVCALLLSGAYGAYPLHRAPIIEIGWLEALRAELAGLVTGSDAQWQLALCLGLYFAGFTWLGRVVRSAEAERDRRGPWLLAFALLTTVAYALDYPRSASRADFLTLLFALTCAQGLRFWRLWDDRQGEQFRVEEILLTVFAVVTAAVAFAHPEHSLDFEYREADRWHGVWSTPNVYGLLMASAFAVATGRLVNLLNDLRGAWVRATGWLGIAGITGTSLVMSYSRGAWLGAGLAMLGLLYLAGVRSCPIHAHLDGTRGQPTVGRGKPNAMLLYVATTLISWSIIGYWTLRHTEIPLLRRVFTIANPYDMSWRNRLAVIPPALQMISARPRLGHGWGNAESIFDSLYKPDHLTEGNAVTQNDFIMVGMTLGLPALGCLLMWMLLTFVSERRRPPPEPGPLSASIIAGIASLPLLVGLMFDGVLFKCAIAVPLFCLMQLAGKEEADRVNG